MKKLLLPLLLLLHINAVAQLLENIKNNCILQQYSMAKTAIDKVMQDPSFNSVPEAYILKAAVYGALAAEAIKNNPPQAENLAAEGDAAFTKYKEKDAGMQLLADVMYQNGPLNLYTVYYSTGYSDYTQKKWNSAFDKIKKAVNYSDILIQKKILAVPLDTNVLILAGITAENSGNTSAAAMYYSRLAGAGIKGEGFETVYRFLVSYYFSQKNYTLFEKYKALGKTIYPASDFFTYDKVDFAIGSKTGFDNQYAAAQAVLNEDPENFKANEVLGEIIYDELEKRVEKGYDTPGFQQLEATMINAFKKAAALKPGYINAHIYMGDYFINKAVIIDKEKNNMADTIKKKQLAEKYGTALEAAGSPYENAAALFAKSSSLSDKDKLQYKKVVSYLSDIALYKKVNAPAGSDKNKWAAAAAKWEALYETIK